ncbi:MAG: hypothetical protein JJT89_09260 [Nitriliruptoraceae bacterium]|nr:hypothetical protein [Nitriliruptoraceae bacterium]
MPAAGREPGEDPAPADATADASGEDPAPADATAAAAEDAFAGLRADVELYRHADPLVTLRGLSDASGIAVDDLVHYVLARWASGGNEALLELGTSGVDHLARAIDEAERADTDTARLAAYATVRDLVAWLRSAI